jgi:hypothetical protein
MDTFGHWWSLFQYKTQEERLANYNSLPKKEQLDLRKSFLHDGWCQLFCQNHIDECLDLVKTKYSIDLFDLRIQAIRKNKVFLLPKTVWEEIEGMFLEYEPLFNSDILFGGLYVKSWGKNNQFVIVRSLKEKT